MACVRKRNNSYRIEIFLGRDANGKQIRYTETYKPSEKGKRGKQEAIAYANTLETKYRQGQIMLGEKYTLASFVARWKEGQAFKKLGPRSQFQYCHDLEEFFLPILGNVQIDKIRVMDIDNIILQLDNGKRNAHTINKIIDSLNNVMKYAVKKKVINYNPIECCDRPTEKHSQKDIAFTPKQINEFLDFLTEPYTINYKEHKSKSPKSGKEFTVQAYSKEYTVPLMFRAFFWIAVATGCRRGELCALKWEDIDFTDNTIDINKGIASVPGKGQFESTTKTEYSNRVISVPQKAMDILKAWRKEEYQIMLSYGDAWQGHFQDDFEKNYVFIQSFGKVINVDTPYHEMKKIIKRYNEKYKGVKEPLPSYPLNGLRHTEASLVNFILVDDKANARRMGHSTPTTTMKYYISAYKEQDVKIAKQLDNLLTASPL